MAQFQFTNNTYAGEALAGFMASTLLEADSVSRNLVTVVNNVKNRMILLDVDDEVQLQDPSGMFHDQGTTAEQNESYLDPIVFEFMKQEQWDKLIQSWEVSDMGAGSMADYDGVVELSDFMVQRYLTKIQIANERLYWLGKANTKEATFTAPFPGFLAQIEASNLPFKMNLAAQNSVNTQMTATAISAAGIVTVADTSLLNDGDVVSIKVTAGAIKETTNVPAGVPLLNAVQSYNIAIIDGTTFQLVRNYNNTATDRKNATFTGVATAAKITFINKGNVLSVLARVYNNLDPADRMQPDFNILVPYHISWAYAQAQADKAVNVLNAFTDKKVMDYLGEKLQVLNHFKANTILAARAANLFLGVDLLGDQSSLQTVNLKPTTGDDVVRMKARMKAATQIQFYNEIFYLSSF